MSIPQSSRPVHYPESDGRPLPETEVHLQQLVDLYASLRAHFRDRPEIHVSADLLLYYEEGKPTRVVAPDVMVVFGIKPGLRRVYKLWEEGKAPAAVFEITSAGSRLKDLGTKKEVYAMMGVAEYYLFDPTCDYLNPPLRAYRLHHDQYLEFVERPLVSPALGLELRIVDGVLRLADPATTRLVPVPDENAREAKEARKQVAEAEERVRQVEERIRQAEENARQEKAARQDAEERSRQAEEHVRQAEERARQEAAARQALEDELARLRRQARD